MSVTAFTGLAVFAPTSAYAACSSFLTPDFPAWYRGLEDPSTCELDESKIKDNPDGIGGVVWIIVLNIIDIALRLVGLLAVGFIIYGGFRYLTSAGDPSRAAAGRDTIFKAVIGLVIAIVAASAVGFIVGRLGS